MSIRRIFIGALAGGILLAGFAGCAQATIYIATFTGKVGKLYDGGTNVHGGLGDVIDAFDQFGGGDLTGADYTAVFRADFNATTLVTNTGKALAVNGAAPVTGKLSINGHSVSFTSSFQGLFGLSSQDPMYGNGVALQVVQQPFVGLDNEIENFDPLRPILDASLTTPVTYAVSPGDITYGLFSVPKAGPGFGLMTAFLIPSSVTVAAVPEPASWAMMLVGIGAIGGLFRKARGQGRQVARAG